MTVATKLILVMYPPGMKSSYYVIHAFDLTPLHSHLRYHLVLLPGTNFSNIILTLSITHFQLIPLW